jgi:hypothetical protein
MRRAIMTTLAALAVGISCTGCMGRMIGEGMGAATGASGKVVASSPMADLTRYKGVRIEPITVAAEVQVPAEGPSRVRADLTTVAAARGLAPVGEPTLILTGEVIHYETAGMVDTAIGPLAEVIVRAKLTDAQTGKVVAQANLIGRSKATTSGGEKDLAAGVGKALDKWLKEGGLKKPGEKEKE